MSGLSFELMAADKIGKWTGFRYDVSEFRLGGIGIDYIPTFDPVAVPEPSTIALFGLGLLSLPPPPRRMRVVADDSYLCDFFPEKVRKIFTSSR